MVASVLPEAPPHLRRLCGRRLQEGNTLFVRACSPGCVFRRRLKPHLWQIDIEITCGVPGAASCHEATQAICDAAAICDPAAGEAYAAALIHAINEAAADEGFAGGPVVVSSTTDIMATLEDPFPVILPCAGRWG